MQKRAMIIAVEGHNDEARSKLSWSLTEGCPLFTNGSIRVAFPEGGVFNSAHSTLKIPFCSNDDDDIINESARSNGGVSRPHQLLLAALRQEVMSSRVVTSQLQKPKSAVIIDNYVYGNRARVAETHKGDYLRWVRSLDRELIVPDIVLVLKGPEGSEFDKKLIAELEDRGAPSVNFAVLEGKEDHAIFENALEAISRFAGSVAVELTVSGDEPALLTFV